MEGYFYNDDGNTLTDDGYSASLYAKYMFYQNKKETGGASVKTRAGMKPGTIIGEDRQKDAFQSYWMNFPCTIPFFKNKLLLDLMTGLSVTRNYGQTETTAWSFTYSTPAAWYPFDPRWSAVLEVFGTERGVKTIPEYKTGVRWEPGQHALFALTYDNECNGNTGAGFEFGIMVFSPPFVCLAAATKPKRAINDTCKCVCTHRFGRN